MDVESFAKSAAGILVPIAGHDGRLGEDYEHFAFLPHPLPTELELSATTWTAVSSAMHDVGRLDEASKRLPNPRLLRRQWLRREAVSTSALEGTYAPIGDVLEAEVEPDAPRSPEVREVLNYVAAAEHGYDLVTARHLTFSFLCELQFILVRGTRAERPDSGRMREVQVVIAPEGTRVHEARFVPPPPDDRLRAGIDAWEGWLAAPRHGMSYVVQAALAHYQFETLHPFSDGNGRIGRLVVVLQLMRLGAIREPVLTVSPWLEARRTEYTAQLLEVSRTGHFDPFVAFFADGLRASAVATLRQIDALMDLQAQTRELLHARGIRGVALQIADCLIGTPVVSAGSVANQFGVTVQGAHRALQKLAEAGVVELVSRSTYRYFWVAPRVLAIVSGDDTAVRATP